jgi:hypothetical protein
MKVIHSKTEVYLFVATNIRHKQNTFPFREVRFTEEYSELNSEFYIWIKEMIFYRYFFGKRATLIKNAIVKPIP